MKLHIKKHYKWFTTWFLLGALFLQILKEKPAEQKEHLHIHPYEFTLSTTASLSGGTASFTFRS